MGARRRARRRRDADSANLADGETFHPRAAGTGHRAAAPGVRRLLGVDVVGLPPLPRVPPRARSHRRVQREVHVEPDGPARRVRAHAAGSRAQRRTATSSRTRRGGRSRACASPTAALPWCRHDAREGADGLGAPAVGLGESGLVDDVRRGLGAQPRSLPPQVALRRPRLGAVRPHHAAAGVLPDRGGALDPARARRSHRAAVGATTLVELGSGTSDKTRTLLDALAATGQLRRFVPVDVSEATLRDAADQISARVPRTCRSRRSSATSRCTSATCRPAAADGRVPRRHDRQPLRRGARGLPRRARRLPRVRRLPAARDRPGEARRPPHRGLRRPARDHRRVRQQLAARGQPRARCRLRPRRVRLRRLLGPAHGADGPPAARGDAAARADPRARVSRSTSPRGRRSGSRSPRSSAPRASARSWPRPGSTSRRSSPTTPATSPSPSPPAPGSPPPGRLWWHHPLWCAYELEGVGHAGDRGAGRPVGRRGQGQGDRPPRQPCRLRREVQRRQQRRAHGRDRRREVRAAPAALGHPHRRA